MLAVHHVEDSDAPKDADVLTADVEVVWRGQADSERASAIVHLANETLACRFSLTYLRLTLRSYAWVTTPERKGEWQAFFVRRRKSQSRGASPYCHHGRHAHLVQVVNIHRRRSRG